jgi:glycosyltransferase involved in cell wall biosynthesis
MARELTIVVPTKNGADRIGGMIRSLLAEIDAAGVLAEIIVVDDLSTDDTPKVLGAIAADDHRVAPMAGPGRGPGAARNAAVRAARSRWIAFADDDDAWTPGRLATQLEALRANPDAVLSLTDYAHVREDQPDAVLPSAFEYWPLWRSFRARTVSRIEDARPLIAAENAVGTSTVMVSRDTCAAVGGFDETLPSASDWDLWLRLAAVGPTLVLNIEGVRYAMRAGSVSSNRSARDEAMRTIIARHPDLPAWARRRAIARLATGRSEAAADQGRTALAVRHALHACLVQPGRRPLRRLLGLLTPSFA